MPGSHGLSKACVRRLAVPYGWNGWSAPFGRVDADISVSMIREISSTSPIRSAGLEICKAMPEVSFWIPTRAWQQPAGPLPIFDPLLNVLRQLANLTNITVRRSALNFGDYAPTVAGLHAGSTAAMPDIFRAYQCPAYDQGGHCGEFRACWDAKTCPFPIADIKDKKIIKD